MKLLLKVVLFCTPLIGFSFSDRSNNIESHKIHFEDQRKIIIETNKDDFIKLFTLESDAQFVQLDPTNEVDFETIGQPYSLPIDYKALEGRDLSCFPLILLFRLRVDQKVSNTLVASRTDLDITKAYFKKLKI